jgi:type I restriction enzyme, S subunit
MSWAECKLGDLMTLKRGHDLPDRLRKEGDIPIVSSSGITGSHSEAKAKPPGVVTGRYGTLGEVFFIQTDYWPLNTALYVIDFKGNDPRFVAYFLKNALKNYKSDKAAVPGVDRNVLHALDVLAPERPIQEKIVSFLSNYDDLIENNRRRIALLEEAAQQLYKEWFVHVRFPGHEHIKITDGVPEGWEKKPLRQIATLNYGKALKADTRIEGPYPVYGSSGIVGSHNKPLVKGPGIVVGRKGNVGSIHWSYRDHHPIDTVYYISAEESNYFLYHALLNTTFINTDVAVPGLNRDLAYSREIIVPSDKLLTEFHDVVTPVYGQIDTLAQYNEKLTQARDILLPKLMSGEIAP